MRIQTSTQSRGARTHTKSAASVAANVVAAAANASPARRRVRRGGVRGAQVLLNYTRTPLHHHTRTRDRTRAPTRPTNTHAGTHTRII